MTLRAAAQTAALSLALATASAAAGTGDYELVVSGGEAGPPPYDFFLPASPPLAPAPPSPGIAAPGAEGGG